MATQLKQAIIKGCERATREHPLRSSVVHPVTRKNEHTSCGREVPVIHIDFAPAADTLSIEMIPKGTGSENNSWLKMAMPADGIDAIKTFVVDCVLDAGGKTCPPTIVGVGVGGTADLCVHLSKVAATRPLGSKCDDPEGAKLEVELSAGREPAWRRPAGPGRGLDFICGAYRNRRDAYHHEPGGGQHAVPLGAARARDVHAAGPQLRFLIYGYQVRTWLITTSTCR